jgi:hypothetical protein
VIRDDLPFLALFHDNLQQPRSQTPRGIATRARRQLSRYHARDRREHFNYGNIGPHELERDDVLLQRRLPEAAREDHLVLFEKRLVPGEELARDVGKCAVRGEVA